MNDLNRNELEALRVLWEHGVQKPAQIQEHFSWPIDNGTLRSVLKVLLDKGFLTREKSGKAYLYRAKASRKQLFTRMMRQMAHIFASGSRDALILQLVRSEQLSEEAVAELQRIASEKKKQERKGTKS